MCPYEFLRAAFTNDHVPAELRGLTPVLAQLWQLEDWTQGATRSSLPHKALGNPPPTPFMSSSKCGLQHSRSRSLPTSAYFMPLCLLYASLWSLVSGFEDLLDLQATLIQHGLVVIFD